MKKQNKNENTTTELTVSMKTLKERICKYDRSSVLYLLNENVMDQIPAVDQPAVIQQIVMLRDMKLIDALAKHLNDFTVDMMDIDLNNRLNNDFINNILNNYSKKFDLSDEQTCNDVFSLARTVGNSKLCASLMKKTSPSDDLIVDTLLRAAVEKDPKSQIEALDKAGYKIHTKNSANQTAADLLRKRITDYTYPSGKKGIQMKRADQNTLQYLEQAAAKKDETKKNRLTLIKGSMIAIVVVAFLSAATFWYMR